MHATISTRIDKIANANRKALEAMLASLKAKLGQFDATFRQCGCQIKHASALSVSGVQACRREAQRPKPEGHATGPGAAASDTSLDLSEAKTRGKGSQIHGTNNIDWAEAVEAEAPQARAAVAATTTPKPSTCLTGARETRRRPPQAVDKVL